MRKLPVYLLIDTSGSMYGEPIASVKNGMEMLAQTLQKDPYALETAHLSVITFASDVRQEEPLTEITAFKQPILSAKGQTRMGAALELLARQIDAEVSKTTAEKKGDWKPLVFIMSDGEPTDDISRGINDLKERKPGLVVACAAGANANINELKRITENVVRLDNLDNESIRAFFKWVSASISAGSQRVESGKDVKALDELPPPPDEVIIV